MWLISCSGPSSYVKKASISGVVIVTVLSSFLVHSFNNFGLEFGALSCKQGRFELNMAFGHVIPLLASTAS